MTWSVVRDVVSAVCLLSGALLALVATIGIVRFDNLFSRMHAATKPQVLGILLVLLGVGFRMNDPHTIGLVVLVGAFQLFTAPIGAHMLGRQAYRTGLRDGDERLVDESAPAQPVLDDPPA